jgi:beta-lactamase regulating signal transducer with metallopeptidase domain
MLTTLGWTLFHSLWQGAIIALILFLVNLFIKPARLRYVIACMALLLMLIVPVVTFGYLTKPHLPQPLPLAAELEPSHVVLPASETATSLPDNSKVLASPIVTASKSQTFSFDLNSWRRQLTPLLANAAILWLLGIAVLSLRLLVQCIYAERFKRKHTLPAQAQWQTLLHRVALHLNINRSVRLLESSLVDVPTVIGFLKPVILLPTSTLMGLTTEQLESILAHELAHIRRHDYLANLLQSLIETLLFYHPAVWWVSHRIRVEREHCCDDVAVAASSNPVTYAKALERLESLRHEPQLALGANGGNLMHRIKRIVGKSDTSPNWFVGMLLVSLMMVFALVVSAQKVDAQPSEKYQKQIWVSAIGAVAFSSDFSEIKYIGPEDTYPKSRVIIEEKEGDNSKQIEITQSLQGKLIYTYAVNGQVLPTDESIMTWYKEIWSLIAQVNKTGDFGNDWRMIWSQSAMPLENKSESLSYIGDLDNAFGYKKDDSAFISYIKNPGSGFPGLLSGIEVCDICEKPSDRQRLIDEEQFSAYGYIIQAAHAINHNLMNTNSGYDFSINTYVADLLENVPLTPLDLEAIIPLIEAIKKPEIKKKLLLKYLDKVSSRGETDLEQQATQMLAESEALLTCDSVELSEYVGAECESDSLLQTRATVELEKLGAAQEELKEIRLTVIGDVDVHLNNNLINGQINEGAYIVFEVVGNSKRQAVFMDFQNSDVTLSGNLALPTLSFKSESTLTIPDFIYVLNPTFSYVKGKALSIKADEIRIEEGGDLEPWFLDATNKIAGKYLEIADKNLPLNGATGVLEDGTPYSILFIKDPEIFSSQFSTMSANSTTRQKILEQAFDHGVISEKDYTLLLKRQSVIDNGLEYAAKNLELQFGDSDLDLNSAILDLTMRFREANSNSSESSSGVMVDDPNIQIPQLVQEILAFGLSELEIQRTLLLINQIPDQKVKAETLLFIAPYVLETNNTLLLNLYDDLAMSLPEELRNTVLADIPAKQVQASAGKFDSRIALGSKNEIQVFSFTFDPKKAFEETGITGLLEEPYQLRLEVQDTQGHREVFDEMIPAGEDITVPVGVYGQGVIETFANNISIYTRYIP